MTANLERIRREKGLSRERLAERAGISPMHLYRIEKGKTRLTEKMARRLAAALDLPIEILLPSRRCGAPVLGTAQTGVWREASEDPLHVEDIEAAAADAVEQVAFMSDPRFPYAPVFALRVEGDGMDQVFPPGSYALCVRLADAGLEVDDLPAGAIVVVHRRRHDIYEVSIRRLSRRDGEPWLDPLATSPRHKPIPLRTPRHTQETETRIHGLVIGKYERL